MDLLKLNLFGWQWNPQQEQQQQEQQQSQQHKQDQRHCECHQVQSKLADMVSFLGGNPAHMPSCLCALEKLTGRPRSGTYTDSGDDEIDTAIILDGLDHLGKHYKLPDAFRLRKTIVCTPGDLLRTIRPRAYVVFSCNFSSMRLMAPASQPRSVAPPPPIPERFDTSMAVEWLKQCRSRHRECSGSPTYGVATGRPASGKRVQVPGLRLIDCEARRIVAVPGFPVYLALSYVWRLTFPPPASNRPQKIESPAGLPLPSTIPQVIQDAILLTRLLGVRYLWVDRYCIDNGNPQRKLAQIRRMHHIYHGAELTIVAAGSGDGLPGMGALPRPSVRSPAGKKELVVTILPGHPSHTIGQTEWASRAWTYQEAALARRRLVFTDSQVYYDCDRMSRWESLEHLLRKRPLRQTKTSIFDQVEADSSRQQHVSIRDRLFGGDENAEGRPPPILSCPDSVTTAIENFTRRKLSFDDDSLDAFSGILGNFQSLQPNLAHVWGIPYPRRPLRPSSTGGWKGKAAAVTTEKTIALYEASDGSETTEPPASRIVSIGTSATNSNGSEMVLVPPRYRLRPGIVRSIWNEDETSRLVRLCWAHRHSRWDFTPSRRPRRRPQFPSWSWVGWDGAVVWLPASGTFEKYPHGEADEAVDLSYAYYSRSGGGAGSITRLTTRTDDGAAEAAAAAAAAAAVMVDDDSSTTAHFPDALWLRAWSIPTTRLAFSYEDKEGAAADGDRALKWTLGGNMVVSLSLSDGPATPELFVDEAKRGIVRIYWMATTNLWMNPERARCIVVERREGAKAIRIGSLIVHCNGRPLRSLERPEDEIGFQLEEVMLF